MTTEIARSTTGRALYHYDLLDELMDRHALEQREAHDGIANALAQIIDIDGEDGAIVGRRPVRPELLTFNPHDLDVDWWIEITDDAAGCIREQFAACYAENAARD